jgi:hypothetical protein
MNLHKRQGALLQYVQLRAVRTGRGGITRIVRLASL